MSLRDHLESSLGSVRRQMLIWELIFFLLTITYHKFYHIMSRVKMISEFRQDNMAL